MLTIFNFCCGIRKDQNDIYQCKITQEGTDIFSKTITLFILICVLNLTISLPMSAKPSFKQSVSEEEMEI